MAVVNYTSLTETNTLALELASLTSEPTDLDSLLTDSAAVHTAGTVTIHRPYYVAAKMLDHAANTSRLNSAEGAVFDPPAVRIRSLLNQQAAFDTAMLQDNADYTIPAGHEAGGGLRLVF